MFRNLDRGLHNRFYKISPRRPSLSASDGASGIRHRAESPGPRRAEPEKGARLSPAFAQPPLSARKRAMGEAKQHALSARKRMRSSYKKGTVERRGSCAAPRERVPTPVLRPELRHHVSKPQTTTVQAIRRQRRKNGARAPATAALCGKRTRPRLRTADADRRQAEADATHFQRPPQKNRETGGMSPRFMTATQCFSASASVRAGSSVRNVRLRYRKRPSAMVCTTFSRVA